MPAATALTAEEAALVADYRARLEGTNINPQTLLATDYLNHFSEIVMLIELIPDMPEMFEEARAWQPRTYREHFRASQFRERELAIEAYDHAPAKYRKPFEDIIGQMDVLVAGALDGIGAAVARGDVAELRAICQENARLSHRLIEQASAVIHGGEPALDQREIDGLLDQNAIDDLLKG